LVYRRELEARREAIIRSISGQGKSTEELAAKIGTVDSKAELEDLYLPYKPKRRTRADIARERGLGPLAESILSDRSVVPNDLAQSYLSADVADAKSALEGARDILAESFAENVEVVGRLRSYMTDNAFLHATVIDGEQEAGAKFRSCRALGANPEPPRARHAAGARRGDFCRWRSKSIRPTPLRSSRSSARRCVGIGRLADLFEHRVERLEVRRRHSRRRESRQSPFGAQLDARSAGGWYTQA
jgi:hypothetical protein